MGHILSEATRRAQRYLDGLPGRPVFPAPSALAALNGFALGPRSGPGIWRYLLRSLHPTRMPETD